MDLWEAHRKAYDGRTISVSMGYTGKSVLPFFGAMRPDQIIDKDVEAYTRERRAAGIQDGTIWTQLNHLRMALSWAVKKAGLQGVSPHVLRHTAAVHMAEAGHSMAEIAQMLGHSDSRTTERIYARFSPGYLRKAASALEFGTVPSVR